MRNAWLLALVLVVGACDDSPRWGPFPVEDHAARIELPDTPVEFGRGFSLTVERVLPAGESAGEVAGLEPLELVEVGRDRREQGGRVQERIRFRAHAFQTGEVDVTGPAFRVGGDDGRLVVGSDARLLVRSALPEDDAGVLEPAPGPLSGPPPVWPWLLGGGVTVGVVAVLWRRRPTVVEPVQPTPAVAKEAPQVVALRALDALEATEGLGRVEFHARLAGVVRAYVGAVAGFDPTRRTTEELLHSERLDRNVPSRVRDALGPVLLATDRARFGGDREAEPDRDDLLRCTRACLEGGAA